MRYRKKSRIFSRSISGLLIILMVIHVPVLLHHDTMGIRYLEGNLFRNVTAPAGINITSIGDLDDDEFIDILVTDPKSSVYNSDGGVAYLFFGSENGFPRIKPGNADIIFYGGEGFELSSSFAVWDIRGTGYGELVFGCPGSEGGNGSALIFDSVLVNGSPQGTALGPTSAETILTVNETTRFGQCMESGYFGGDGMMDLLVLSGPNSTNSPGLHAFFGGGSPGLNVTVPLPALSVDMETESAALDLMDRGKDTFIYSAPDRGEVRMVHLQPTEIKLMSGSNGIGQTITVEDIDLDGSVDLLLSNPKSGIVRVFYGADPYWDTLPGMNAEMDNITVTGSAGTGFGTSVVTADASPFEEEAGLFISAPFEEVDQGPTGNIYRFDIPPAGDLSHQDDAFRVQGEDGTSLFGRSMVSIGDTDSDNYPELIFSSLDGSGRFNVHLYDRGPNPPRISLDSPSREGSLFGVVEIRATVTDKDGDATPHDVRFYSSIDNRSWGALGNGTPDRVEGDQAVKEWNTSNYANRIYFLKVEVTDSFGLSAARYSNSVEVHNHGKPSVILIYPGDGSDLKGMEEITARVDPGENEEIDPPVRFLYSRDGSSWKEFGNATEPESGSEVDYTYLLDTTGLDDGPIWFRINATTVYGLGSNASNDAPCNIDNAFAPVIEITGNYTGNISGTLNITARITDRDGDISPPIRVEIRDPDVVPWDPLGNMTGPVGNDTYYLEVDTTTIENGRYQLKITAQDLTFNEVTSVLNRTITVHNPYAPVITIVGVDMSEPLSGIVRVRASLSDRDSNYNDSAVKFFYKSSDVDVWNSISRVLVNNDMATVDWDTTALMNGNYDLLAEVTDRDDLTGTDMIQGVRIKNIIEPVVQGSLPSSSGKLKGSVQIFFNITDDQQIPDRNIRVEVFVFSEWINLSGIDLVNPSLPFVPGKSVEYSLVWDTTRKDENGDRIFPDGPGYEIRITVTDPDGETDTWRSVISYRVDNTDVQIGDQEDEAGDAGLNTGIIALIAMIAVVLFFVLLIGIFIWRGRRSERKGSVPDIEVPSRKEEGAGEEEEEEKTADSSGWGEGASMYDDVPTTTAHEEEAPQAEPIAQEPPSDDLFHDIFTVGGESEKPVSRAPAPSSDLDDMELEVDLPEEALPSQEEEEEDWEDVEEWEDEEEEEDWEELEELDDDEEDWEEEEDEEDIFVIQCRCGEEIEIPDSRKHMKFKCPSCGRTGKLRK